MKRKILELLIDNNVKNSKIIANELKISEILIDKLMNGLEKLGLIKIICDINKNDVCKDFVVCDYSINRLTECAWVITEKGRAFVLEEKSE